MTTNKVVKSPAATKWHWRPTGLLENNPLFLSPLNIKNLIRWYIEGWKPLSEYFYFALISVLAWFFLQPPTQDFTPLEYGSVMVIYFRNLALTIITAGGFHLYFYSIKKQGLERKYEARGLNKQSKLFTFNNLPCAGSFPQPR